MSANAEIQTLIDEYSQDYCAALELAYGQSMMSEGGAEAIDALFEDVDLHRKQVLDIGSGLGGLAFYLASQYELDITGLEINPGMIKSAESRIPGDLKSSVRFKLYDDVANLPFEDASFDIVCSKGVFTHIEYKQPLFKEIFRVLKPGGQLVMNDWLSLEDAQWSPDIEKMAELEGLTMHAVSLASYRTLLAEAGFGSIQIEDETKLYSAYNQKIVNDAVDLDQDSILGYQLIANAMKTRELLVYKFKALALPQG